MARRSEITEYLVHHEKERDVSPHTVKAYARDLIITPDAT
jgi:site-specific recombinase XerC